MRTWAHARRTEFDEYRLDALIQEVRRLDQRRSETDLRDRALLKSRVLVIEALAMSGRIAEAVEETARWLHVYGPHPRFLVPKARLQFQRGLHKACIQTAELALIGLEPADEPSGDFFGLCALKADSLCALGRRAEAREFLVRMLERAPAWRENGLAALRRTLETKEDLAWFFTYCAPFFSGRSALSSSALLQYSTAARDFGQMDHALMAIRRRFINGVAQPPPALLEPEAPRSNWMPLARVALLTLRDEMKEAGEEFFLISGTLLGCVREGRILGHDKDIDVGVAATVNFEKLIAQFRTSGRFVVMLNIPGRKLRVRHYNGVMIDIFVHFEQDGRVHHLGHRSGWWNSPFELTDVEFLGEVFRAPRDTDRYLTENYGDWRTPKTAFDTFLDTPNMYVTNPEDMVWYYYKRLYDYYSVRKLEMSTRIWEALVQTGAATAEDKWAFYRLNKHLSQVAPAATPPAAIAAPAAAVQHASGGWVAGLRQVLRRD